MTDLVRIQSRVSKKHYLKTKRTYEYERLSLDIPKKFHEALKPFLEKELNVDVKLENDVAVISLSPVKTFRHAENTPDKNAQKPVRTGSGNIRSQILFKYLPAETFFH